MKKILLFISFLVLLNGNDLVEQNEKKSSNAFLTFKYLQSIEKGTKRDFFINEYLKKDILPSDAFKTLSLIDNMNKKIFTNFAKKYSNDETLAVSQCMNMNTEELINSYADCIAAGMTINKASKLSSFQIEQLKEKLENKYPSLLRKLNVIQSPIPFTKYVLLDKDSMFDFYFKVSKDFRKNYLNYKLPKRAFSKLFIDKNKFNKFLDISLRDNNLNILNRSLLNTDDKYLSTNSSFLLGLNALRFDKKNISYKYLTNALIKSKNINEDEKIYFWLYKITDNTNYLNELLKIKTNSIYKIFAKQLIRKNDHFTQKINISKTFQKLIKKATIDKQAFYYAIAKTKSSFDSNKVSKDFKLGIMQINIKEIYKILKNDKEDIGLLKLFDESFNFKLADKYIRSFYSKENRLVYNLLKYDNKENLLQLLKDNKFSSLLDFEFALSSKNEYIKTEIMNYYFYISNLKKKNIKNLDSFIF